MLFGMCTSIENSAAVRKAGWDFIEENVQELLQGKLPGAEWKGAERIRQSALPVLAANCLVPGSLKITGPTVDPGQLNSYITVVLRRARQLGLQTLVFGSGGARQVPDGWDREKARDQIIAFARMTAPIAAENGITIVLEHLARRECNIVNLLAEELEYVQAVGHPNFRCLLDTYHFWTNDDSLDALAKAAPYIAHVHLADRDQRVAPGESKTADYRPIFGLLKRARYAGPLSVEAVGVCQVKNWDPRVLEFIKQQWAEAS